jgi:hypothetical protein
MHADRIWLKEVSESRLRSVPFWPICVNQCHLLKFVQYLLLADLHLRPGIAW